MKLLLTDAALCRDADGADDDDHRDKQEWQSPYRRNQRDEQDVLRSERLHAAFASPCEEIDAKSPAW